MKLPKDNFCGYLNSFRYYKRNRKRKEENSCNWKRLKKKKNLKSNALRKLYPHDHHYYISSEST